MEILHVKPPVSHQIPLGFCPRSHSLEARKGGEGDTLRFMMLDKLCLIEAFYVHEGCFGNPVFAKMNSGGAGGEGGDWDWAGAELLRARRCLQRQQEPGAGGRGRQGLKRRLPTCSPEEPAIQQQCHDPEAHHAEQTPSHACGNRATSAPRQPWRGDPVRELEGEARSLELL